MDILTPDSEEFDINELLNKIKEHKLFSNLSLENNMYSLITNVKIPDNIKLLGFFRLNCNLYVFHETNHDIILLGYQNSPLKGWYKVKKESELKLLLEYFESKNKVYYNTHRFYLSTQYDFLTILNYIRNSFFVTGTVYIDEKDENLKIDKLTEIDNANMFSLQIKSDIDYFYVYTKYSNSKLKFESHKGFIIIELNYNQIKLRNRYDPFDKFLPSDISILLNCFELKSINDILYKKELSDFEIDICILLAKDKKNLNKLKIKLEEIKKNHEELGDYIDNVIERIKSDEIFLQIENDGIFRSFENSVDILIKTVYERLNESKCTDYTYINEILKYKVNNIFYSRLL
jgi:hypothetical protein